MIKHSTVGIDGFNRNGMCAETSEAMFVAIIYKVVLRAPILITLTLTIAPTLMNLSVSRSLPRTDRQRRANGTELGVSKRPALIGQRACGERSSHNSCRPQWTHASGSGCILRRPRCGVYSQSNHDCVS